MIFIELFIFLFSFFVVFGLGFVDFLLREWTQLAIRYKYGESLLLVIDEQNPNGSWMPVICSQYLYMQIASKKKKKKGLLPYKLQNSFTSNNFSLVSSWLSIFFFSKIDDFLKYISQFILFRKKIRFYKLEDWWFKVKHCKKWQQ